MKLCPAVFLDRDGTLIEHVHHLVDPSQVRLIPGAAEAVIRLRAAGYQIVLVTNQSVIGRGFLTEEGLDRVHAEMNKQLAARGTQVDGIYFCPVAPTVSDPRLVDHPDRKPGPGMLLRAARELDLDLRQSWMVGDMVSDLLAGRNAGCKGSILVRTGHGQKQEGIEGHATYVATDLLEAAQWILSDPRLPQSLHADGARSGGG